MRRTTELTESLEIKEKVREILWIPSTLLRLAISYEMQKDWIMALQYYQKSIETNTIGNLHSKAEALTGVLRVRYHLEDVTALKIFINDALALAEPNEFNDHLASINLTLGHIISDGKFRRILNDTENLGVLDTALYYYQQAIIYALRYNRFLLDQVLSGHPHGTPLRPIIPHCLERGEEGKKILVALRDWWKTGVNDIGTPRPDMISPIPEGIPPLEAKKLPATASREMGQRKRV